MPCLCGKLSEGITHSGSPLPTESFCAPAICPATHRRRRVLTLHPVRRAASRRFTASPLIGVYSPSVGGRLCTAGHLPTRRPLQARYAAPPPPVYLPSPARKKTLSLYSPTPYKLSANSSEGTPVSIESHNLTGLPSPPLLVGQARVCLRDGYLRAGLSEIYAAPTPTGRAYPQKG